MDDSFHWNAKKKKLFWPGSHSEIIDTPPPCVKRPKEGFNLHGEHLETIESQVDE